ncbi:NucA/NucB deoxyribonuclease domain-containing protein [Streptomyces sp. NPDC050504]|uniref:NucA/NucB deoxyribonuclease domain-containing protein n=1 Tax=Streptomyces sp. NPDC050504 TaxID=3365618 RepID=UPI0037A38609
MKLINLFAGAAGLGLLASGIAPTAMASQPGATELRVTVTTPTIGTAPAPQARTAFSPAAPATCTINRITVNRFSQCEWVAIHLDVVQIVNGRPVLRGTADFDVKHRMTLKTNSANWSETFTVSKARTTGQGRGVRVNVAAKSGAGTRATVSFPQGHSLDSAATGSVGYKTTIAPKKVLAKAKTTYSLALTKAGYSPAKVSYASAAYRCDNYFGSTRTNRSGCAIPEVPTAVSMVGLARISEGIRNLRARGGHYGDPYGNYKPLRWMTNKTKETQHRAAVCPRTAPADMQAAGRTSCDEYPFASTYEGGTTLAAGQRSITWVKTQENKSQGGRITAWRGQMHVMDRDPFYVIA